MGPSPKGSSIFFTKNWDHCAITDPHDGIHFFQRSNRNLQFQLPEAAGAVSDCSFSPDGRFFADDVHQPPSFHIWDVSTRQKVLSPDNLPAFRFSDDSGYFAIEGPSHTVEIYSLPLVRKLSSISIDAGVLGEIQGFRFSPGDEMVAVWGTTTAVGLVSVHSPSPVRILDTGVGMVTTVAWSPDGHDIAVGKESGIDRILVFHAADGQLVAAMNEHAARVVDLAFSHNGRYLISGGWDVLVKIWDVTTGSEQLSLEGFAGYLHTGVDDRQFAFARRATTRYGV